MFPEVCLKGSLFPPLCIRQVSPMGCIKGSELLEVRMNNEDGTLLITFIWYTCFQSLIYFLKN